MSTAGAVHRRVLHVMGMPVSLALRGPHATDRAADAAWDRVAATLHEADRTFSTYRPDSVISRLGRGELAEADLPAEVVEVLALGEGARVATGGAFDVVRPAPGGGAALDPSGVVKGWAVERAAAHLRALPGTDFCLSAGGDMVCRVADPEAPAWRVGIEDPHAPGRVVAVVPLRSGAVATSGLAHRGAHIVDARTGRTPGEVASVTVVGPSLTRADIDATSAFALGAEALAWLRTRTDETGLVVWADGRAQTFGHGG